MSEFVKKGAFGYKQVPRGHSDPECSHVILTLEEYDFLLQERSRAKKAQQAAQIWADSEVKKAVAQGKAHLKQAENTAKAALEEVGRQLVIAQEDAAYQRELNENLLRIARERANAARGLKPKKHHLGFIVASSTEREYRYKQGKKLKTVWLWETTLQTPYSVEFTDEQVRRLIEDALLQKEEGKASLMEQLGFHAYYPYRYEDLLQNPNLGRKLESYNIMLEQRLRANFKVGYWEVRFFHTEALGQVPKEIKK